MTIYRSPINYGIDTDHAPMALRKDVLDNLRFLKEYCGFKFHRCHGILDDGIGVASLTAEAAEPVWAMVDGERRLQAPPKPVELRFHFEQAHKVYANVLELGYTPLVELSFLPLAIAADPTKTCCDYRGYCSQPTSYKAWGDLIEAFGASMVRRFGIGEVSKWLFAVWNEPNGGFWFPGEDRFEGYMKLYEEAARGLKRVSKRLQVGGPSTMIAGWAAPDSLLGKGTALGSGGPCEGDGWIETFIARCRAGGIPLDFIETHLYTLDEYEILREKAREMYGPFDFFAKTIGKVNANVARLLPGADVIWGEWSSVHRVVKKGLPFWDKSLSAGTFQGNLQFDTPFAGAFAAKIAGTFLSGEKMCWWTGTDVYHEWGLKHQPYHCGYGLLNIHGIPKPSAHAHHFAHVMDGGTIVKQFADGGTGFLTVRKGAKSYTLAWNFSHPELPETTYELDLRQVGFAVGKGATLSLVDAAHANGRAAWERLGSPAELSPAQEAKVRKAATVETKPLAPSALKKQKLVLQPNGFGLIVSR